MAKTAKSPPASHGTALEAPRSDAAAGDAPGGKLPSDSTTAGATDSQKRGRGRPPKSKSGVVSAQPARKPSGRPKRNVAVAATTAVGRPRRSSTVRATESQVTTGDGSRKRGRPKKDDVAAVPAPAMKRGRKQVAKKSVGRPKKAAEGATGQGAADPKELKKKTALLQKKVKQAAEKLKIAVSAIEEVQKIAAGM
ncbi:putative DNA-binding protein [Hirschfeldia incana]|nr:putative DNA-binding protein [Hirschfeldia incana]